MLVQVFMLSFRPSALSVMAALRSQGKYEEADRLLLRAIGIQETIVGPDHPKLAISLVYRATFLKAQVTHYFPAMFFVDGMLRVVVSEKCLASPCLLCGSRDR